MYPLGAAARLSYTAHFFARTNMSPSRLLHPVCTALSAAAVVAAGAWGAHWLQQIANAPPIERKPLLLAPMLGVLDSCILLPDTTATELGQRCTRTGGSASALIEATLTPLEPLPSHTPAPYRLGYTLQAPLLQLFRPQGNDWVIDQTRVARLVQTVQDNPRPVVLYLFATHFPVDAPLERALAANPDNLLHTPQGPLPVDSYFGIPTYPWTFVRTDTEITSRRVQATRALLNGLCQLPATDRAKIEGITLLGEVHHLFPDFQGGMGWKPPYVVTDYSPTSVQGFQRYLAQHFQHIGRLNRLLGSQYRSFAQVQPPSLDLRTAPQASLAQHLDSFAHGRLPVSGWAFAPGVRHPWVHVYRNGHWVGKTQVNMRREDVPRVHPEVDEPDTGWRLDLDFRAWPPGLHRLDVFLETAPGQLTPMATRQLAVMGTQRTLPTPRPQQPLPSSVARAPGVMVDVDMPSELQTLYYNPLAALWHDFRGQQVVRYLQFFEGVVAQSCFAHTPRYTHQLLAFPNPGWDESKYAVDASLQAGLSAPLAQVRLGVSLYGDATYGPRFHAWLAHGGTRPYGITEFHPLRALDHKALQQLLKQHQAQGAQFLSFFMEPRWQGALVERAHNPFSLAPENAHYHSNALYQAFDELRQGKNNRD